MGGGFGSKFGPDAQGLICARLAKQAGVPVKLFLDRKEEHLDTGNRPSAFAKIRAGVSADGKLTAFDGQSWGTGGAGATSNFPLPYIYQFPNRRRVHTDVYINAGQQRAMRAPGHPQGCFLTEILMDELADRVRMDPVEFRIKNLPTAAPNAAWGDYFTQGAKAFGWEKRHVTGDPTPGPIKNGFGVSAHQWGGGGRGGRAHCDITSDGSVVMKVGTQDLGTGTRTIVAMLTAETLGLPVSAREAGNRRHDVSGVRRVRRQHDGRIDQPGDPHRRRQGARSGLRQGRAAVGRQRRHAGRRGRPHLRQRQHVEGHDVEGCL